MEFTLRLIREEMPQTVVSQQTQQLSLVDAVDLMRSYYAEGSELTEFSVSTNTKTMRRGQVWLYSADPTVGDEIGKTRPTVIVSNEAFFDNLNLRQLMPGHLRNVG